MGCDTGSEWRRFAAGRQAKSFAQGRVRAANPIYPFQKLGERWRSELTPTELLEVKNVARIVARRSEIAV
jgi:hypothetical protein